MGPMCCGMPATFNNISPRLQFWYCKECQKEVPAPPESVPEGDEYEGWPVGIAEYTDPTFVQQATDYGLTPFSYE